MPKKIGNDFQNPANFHEQILKIRDIERQEDPAFKELKNLLDSSHVIDDIFHAREMQTLFPGAPLD